LKSEIIKVDVKKLSNLIKKTEEAGKEIKGKHIILFLGGTGSGKSTTIHFLAGSKMGYIKLGNYKNHISSVKINNEQLKRIKTSPFM
jgi:ABC-type multidrug transport system ATPase subunit